MNTHATYESPISYGKKVVSKPNMYQTDTQTTGKVIPKWRSASLVLFVAFCFAGTTIINGGHFSMGVIFQYPTRWIKSSRVFILRVGLIILLLGVIILRGIMIGGHYSSLHRPMIFVHLPMPTILLRTSSITIRLYFWSYRTRAWPSFRRK